MPERRAPFIAIQTDIRKDERVNVIADVAGYNRHEAMGRLLDLWCWCADRKLDDAPVDCEGYAVPDAVVRRFLGARGVEAILGDDCDELALGARRPDGLIVLRGTESTVRALRGWAKTAAAGGRARATAAGRTRGGQFVGSATESQQDCQLHTSSDPPDFDAGESRKSATSHPCERPGADGDIAGTGDVVSKTTNVQQDCQPDASGSPAGYQPPASHRPAAASVDPRSKILDPESEIPAKSSRACRLAPDWVPERNDANARVEHDAKARGVDLRVELAKMRDWAKGNGARRADWNAVWRNWTRNARTESRRPGTQPTVLEFQLERVAMLEERERQKSGA